MKEKAPKETKREKRRAAWLKKGLSIMALNGGIQKSREKKSDKPSRFYLPHGKSGKEIRRSEGSGGWSPPGARGQKGHV